jgi:hypothetical protein
MKKEIKLLNKKFGFRKSAYAYKDFEERNKRSYNPALASDILEYIYSCIVAHYFYTRIDCPLDVVDYYELIDKMEQKDPELLYKDNKILFKEFFGIGDEGEVSTDDTKKKE